MPNIPTEELRGEKLSKYDILKIRRVYGCDGKENGYPLTNFRSQYRKGLFSK